MTTHLKHLAFDVGQPKLGHHLSTAEIDLHDKSKEETNHQLSRCCPNTSRVRLGSTYRASGQLSISATTPFQRASTPIHHDERCPDPPRAPGCRYHDHKPSSRRPSSPLCVGMSTSVGYSGTWMCVCRKLAQEFCGRQEQRRGDLRVKKDAESNKVV